MFSVFVPAQATRYSLIRMRERGMSLCLGVINVVVRDSIV